ncbi:MAG: type II toxin-antitoxin system Phd/YefM family antitoxin [Janthinobacterium lividum]
MASATEVKNRFGEFMEKARHAPVTVEKTGRKYVVMISHEEFERLQALEDRQWAVMAAVAEKSGYLGSEQTLKLLTQASE